MAWLQSIDLAVFNWINQSLSNPVFDRLMPFLSGNPFFAPALVVCAALLWWKGGARGRLCLCLLMFLVLLGDVFICNPLKHAIGRLRPFHDVLDARLLVGRGGSGSMPSAHAANWFAAAMIVWLYYRRSLWFMLPLAVGISFSRIYNGVHYPSDVLAGAVLGAGYAAGGAWMLNALWAMYGKRWFPDWWNRLPSMLNPSREQSALESALSHSTTVAGKAAPEIQWLRLGYLLIFAFLAMRLIYLASGKIELSEDEAYQWVWSKHLALSYYSKPPLIAYTQRLGTAIWGDTAFGVRFFSPLIAAAISLVLLRFLSREMGARLGFLAVLIVSATPLLSVGAILMTIDPLSVLFWTLAMVSGWKAVQQDSTRYWLLTGLWMGLGFLSKYTALFQLICWAVFLGLWKPARCQLRRPGPYLALLMMALCAVPVLVWNSQHDWITVRHVADNGRIGQPWQPTLRYFWDFVASEAGVLNPVFFIGAIWASVAFWRRRRQDARLVYLFSMGAPLFLFYWLFTLHSRVQPNWIAPSVLPLFCLMIYYWDSRWRAGASFVSVLLSVSIGIGLFAVILLHDTNLIGKITGRYLPPKLDPLRRVRGWDHTAQIIGEKRMSLLAEGKPVFIIGDHYGITGEVSFYLPEAKAQVANDPLVYYRSSDVPENQFYFWPGYRQRIGQNAIFIQQTELPQPPPDRIVNEFASVKDLGMHEALYRGRVMRRLQLFECRDLQ